MGWEVGGDTKICRGFRRVKRGRSDGGTIKIKDIMNRGKVVTNMIKLLV